MPMLTGNGPTYQVALSSPILDGDETVTVYYPSDVASLITTYSQVADGLNSLFYADTGFPVIPSTFQVVVSDPADTYTDDGLGNIKLGVTTVGSIDYVNGSFSLTTPLGHIPVITSTVVVTLSHVPKVALLIDGVKVDEVYVDTESSPVSGVFFPEIDDASHSGWPTTFLVDPLVRRQRISSRARVNGYDWSDIAEETVVTQFFQKNLINFVPPEMVFVDDQQFDFSATQWTPHYTYSKSDQVIYHGVTYASVLDNNSNRLPTINPSWWTTVSTSGDLRSFIQIMAITMDEMKDYIDSFSEVFDIDRCDAQYLPYIAAILGYDLNRSDSTESQRRQLKTAVAWYKVKGTFESFKILFYALGYQIRLYELWTTDYSTFYPELPATYGPYTGLPTYFADADSVPPDDVRLTDNGGTWYRSPHFAIELNSIETPNLTAEGLRYILLRISQIRPAHTVLEYLKFLVHMSDTVDVQDNYYNTAKYNFMDEGWLAGYCTIGDPVYVRSGDLFPQTFTGTYVPPFPTRNGTDATAIDMKRDQVPTHCDPPEDLEVVPSVAANETYFITLRRDGMNIIPAAPAAVDVSTIDQTTFPYRGMTEEIFRDGQYRYLNTLTFSTRSGFLMGEGILRGTETDKETSLMLGEGIFGGSEGDSDTKLAVGEGIFTDTET